MFDVVNTPRIDTRNNVGKLDNGRILKSNTEPCNKGKEQHMQMREGVVRCMGAGREGAVTGTLKCPPDEAWPMGDSRTMSLLSKHL